MFTQATIEKIKFYVYLLKDPRDKSIFYVGKGKGNRVFNHHEDALNGLQESDKLNGYER